MHQKVRVLTAADIRGLCDLIAQWDLDAPPIPEQIAARLDRIRANLNAEVFVAVDGADTPLGYLYVGERSFLATEPVAEIVSFLVDKNHRGTGIGKKLLARAQEWARSKGFSRIELSCRLELKESHHFYESMGFRRARQSDIFRMDIR